MLTMHSVARTPLAGLAIAWAAAGRHGPIVSVDGVACAGPDSLAGALLDTALAAAVSAEDFVGDSAGDNDPVERRVYVAHRLEARKCEIGRRCGWHASGD